MPRPSTDAYWIERVRAIVANDPRRSVAAIERDLEQEAARLDPPRHDSPRGNTIRRIRESFVEGDREGYRFVYWPESFERGDLPWESAPVVSALIKAMNPERPMVRFATAVWHLSEIAEPGESLDRLRWFGQWLSFADTLPPDRALVLRREIEGMALGLRASPPPEWQELRRSLPPPLEANDGVEAFKRPLEKDPIAEAWARFVLDEERGTQGNE